MDTQFGRGFVKGRVYYPAQSHGLQAAPDTAAGPYPIIALNHGWLGRPQNYHQLSLHLASWGFLVSSIGTERGLFGDMVEEAADAQALLHWLEAQSMDPLSPFSGMADLGPIGALGHSMGGGSMAYLIGLEPRVSAVVPMEAYNDGLGYGVQGSMNLRQYPGAILFLAGELDSTAAPETNALEMYQFCIQAARRHFVLLEGAGHSGPVDNPATHEPMSAAEQHRLHRRYVAAFFRAELLGEEGLYGELFGYGVGSASLRHMGEARTSAFWAQPEAVAANTMSVGMTGLEGQGALSMWSLSPLNLATSYGTLGLNPNQATVIQRQQFPAVGVLEQDIAILPQWSQRTLYLQAIANSPVGPALTRTIAIDFP